MDKSYPGREELRFISLDYLGYTIPTTLNVYYLFIEYDLRRCEYDLRSIGIIILSAHCNLYFR